ncbi:putative phytosulfokines 6 [Manihot esculenta]|uniref:Uncharacterized protein n=2 Tax=Manihot esculenta TaxID=3983 RepID=A0ACB7GYL4_MANES|nr:putative phytosulfokines 6 [Manihot esculenta]KAG8644708.1 hypothetical protein MANES_11G157100v8 [Manihot esculenta]
MYLYAEDIPLLPHFNLQLQFLTLTLSLTSGTEAKTMKQSFYNSLLLILLLFLFYSSKLNARHMPSKDGKEEVNLNAMMISSEESLLQMELMGLEMCENGDEECFKRRIVSEAHLDYIYTQHHKP